MKEEGKLSFNHLPILITIDQAESFALLNNSNITFTHINFISDALIAIMKTKTNSIIEIDGNIGVRDQTEMTERLREINQNAN